MLVIFAIFAEEFGLLRSPIMLTGTGSNGTVYTSVIKWSAQRLGRPVNMPVVADTWDDGPTEGVVSSSFMFLAYASGFTLLLTSLNREQRMQNFRVGLQRGPSACLPHFELN